MKRCSKCCETKEGADFNKCKATLDGLHSYCRKCDNEVSRKSHAKNSKARNAIKREWRQNNSEKRRSYHQKRRARKLGAGGVTTPDDLKTIYEKQGGRCAYCRVELNGDYHHDHVIPLSRGGDNWPSNAACACEKCNLSKNDRLLSEWTPRWYELPKTSDTDNE